MFGENLNADTSNCQMKWSIYLKPNFYFMKFIYFLFSFMIIFNSCQKITDHVTKENIDNKISSYLELQVKQNKKLKNYISEIRINIKSTTIRQIDYKHSKVIVANLGDEFGKTEVNKLEVTKEITNNEVTRNEVLKTNKYFLVLYLSNNEIINGHILKIESVASDVVIQNNIYKIINLEESVGFNSDITFRGLNQQFLYQIHYRDGKTGYSVVMSNNELNKSSGNNVSVAYASCIDWYLVTTYYFSDGSTATTEQYLTTTCDNQDCNPDPLLQSVIPSNCDNGSGWNSFEPQKKLCGNYDWKQVGSAHYAILNNLYATFSPNNNPSIKITSTFPDACINIPDHCLSGTNTFSSYFNDAFNRAVLYVETQLSSNNLPGGDYFVQQALKNRVAFELNINCGGAIFNNGGCSGNIPRSNTNYCPLF